MKKVKIQESEFSRDGNAFHLMGCWDRHARRQGVDRTVRKQVLDYAKSGDYDHLLQTLLSHTELTFADC